MRVGAFLCGGPLRRTVGQLRHCCVWGNTCFSGETSQLAELSSQSALLSLKFIQLACILWCCCG